MAKIHIDRFTGEIPAISAKRLPNSAAQIAINCDLRSGQLQPIHEPLRVYDIVKPGAIRTIYKMDDVWLVWTEDVDVVSAEIYNSDFRIFITGTEYPKQTNKTMATQGGDPMTYPDKLLRLGVVPPDEAQPLVVEPQGTGDGTVGEVFSYVYTLVDSLGEESHRSYPTAVDNLEGGQHIRLKNFQFQAYAATGNEIEYLRCYRLTGSATGTAEYEHVKVRPGNLSASPVYDLPIADVPDANTYVYDADDGVTPAGLSQDLGLVLQTEGWLPAPDNMHSLTQFTNAILIGLADNMLCVSEPMAHYAWPVRYRKPLNRKAVGVCVSSTGEIVVGTTGRPYIFIGSDPLTLQSPPLPYRQPCLSKAGMVSSKYGVMYPSPFGMFQLRGTQGTVITKGVINKKYWKALEPEKLISFILDGRYIGFFKGTGRGITFDMPQPEYLIRYDVKDKIVWDGFYDSDNDRLCLLIEAEDGNYYIEAWEKGDDYLCLTFRSKIFTFPGLVNFARAKLDGRFAPSDRVTFKLFAGGRLRQTKRVATDNIFTLVAGYKADEDFFDVKGKVPLDSVSMATSVEELINAGG